LGVHETEAGPVRLLTRRASRRRLNVGHTTARRVLLRRPCGAGEVGRNSGLERLSRRTRLQQFWARICVRSSGLWIVASGAGAFALVAFLRPAASHHPTLAAAAATAITVLVLTAAWLLRAHFEYSRRLRDLLLAGALLMLGLLELCSSALPSALEVHSGNYVVAAPLFGEVFVAAVFVAAALAPSTRLIRRVRHPVAVTGALSAAAVAVAELGAFALRRELISSAGHPVTAAGQGVERPLSLSLVVIGTALFGCAAIAFARRGRAERNRGVSLLAGAAILIAAARLSYPTSPWPLPGWLTPADGLYVLGVALILGAALVQDVQIRAQVARAATVAVRRRLARDLHDGIAQDLAFIAAHSDRMANSLGAEHPLTLAASRALGVSRAMIAALSDCGSTAAPEDVPEAVARELEILVR